MKELIKGVLLLMGFTMMLSACGEDPMEEMMNNGATEIQMQNQKETNAALKTIQSRN